MNNLKNYLDSTDYSNECTTAKMHIAKIAESLAELAEKENLLIVEFGSFLGISTAALALAAPKSTVVSVDTAQEIGPAERDSLFTKYDIYNVRQVVSSTADYLQDMPQVDFIFHDAMHGDVVLPEYFMCLEKAEKAFYAHDFHALTCQQDLIYYAFSVASRKGNNVTINVDRDDLGRQLFSAIFYKEVPRR